MSCYTIVNKVVINVLGALVKVEQALAKAQERCIARTEAKRKAQTKAALQEVEYLNKVIQDTNAKLLVANKDAIRKCLQLERQRDNATALAETISNIQENV